MYGWLLFIAMNRTRKQQLLTEHYLSFYSKAMSILGDEDDAKDAVQEAVVRTLVQLGVADPVKYCMRVTVNESLHTLRRKKRLVDFDESYMVDNTRQEQIVKVVNQGKEQLSPMERLVIEFHREEGQTLLQLAKMIGVSVSTVKRILARADEKMRMNVIDNL